ncbi:MAG: RICIN domain-containing protein [Clostridia bacterium]|nr:RICIN domain-containing protein [Clostridia bacterium]
MKRSAMLLSAVLACLMLVQPAQAVVPTRVVSASALRNTLAKSTISSHVQTGLTLTAEEAAMRLYYLHLITGTGTAVNGCISFDLDRDLTRLEGAVMAVRLMGMEQDVASGSYTHPYNDVPEWAGAYVGYLHSCGLTEINPELLFYPDAPMSQEVFMSYMLYALGYRIAEGDYSILNASALGEYAGIAVKSEDEPLTRGDAVMAMYNTLRTTMKDSAHMLSEKLAEKGVMSHSDAVFLLWSMDAAETQAYMEAVGYTAEWIIPDGYYTIRSAESADNVLNVLSDGPNKDYEGIGVTLWHGTGDITQSFRLERTERGTYLIYAACSKGGFNRVLGTGRDGKNVGLYRAVSSNALEFSIQGSVDGTWTIQALTKNGDKYLSTAALSRGAGIQLSEEKTAANTWVIEKQGIINSAGQDLALFPAQTMQITQGAYDTYSHMNQNALDMQPTNSMAFAPFNAKVVAVNPGSVTCNGVWIESIDKVRYADGSYDYMTILFMHDNDISDLTVGRVLTQGEYFYQNGTAGISSGAHIHVAVYRGRYDADNMKYGSGDVDAEDAFFVLDDTIIRNDYGIDWKTVSEAD